MKKSIHLICNAHLDPCWLWEWQEGAAEVLSTFRTAADLCEQNDTFIFNHNEVILYEWVREYEPQLFERIKKLVKTGKWHIMGGWYLQPDCNMPSGESFVRQILAGRQYFKKNFGVKPATAINFDSFGHSRGLVQILAKSGYDSYIFGRPQQHWLPLENDLFTWVGFDGSEILAKRFRGWYQASLGTAKKQILERMEQSKDDIIEILWGVGNHGGGPSRKDLADVNELIKQRKDINISHSTPEDYFKQARKDISSLKKCQNDLNPWAIGCYSSMIRVKQKHRQLENELYMVEKMASSAAANKLLKYPQEDFASASKDLMFAQFHDILPGSSIQPVEEAALRMMDHGLEILSKIKTRCFFAFASGQKKAQEGQIPVFVYNPHPMKIKGTFECEFNLPDFNNTGTFTDVKVFQNGKIIPAQVERELSNLPIDWRKRIVFHAELLPSQINRFDCTLERIDKKPAIKSIAKNDKILFKNPQLQVVINTRTGLLDQYKVNGVDLISKNAFCPIVLEDNEDPWEMQKVAFGKVIGKFKLLDKTKGTKFSGLHDLKLNSVRIIEDGNVRTVIEAVFGFEESFICQRYKLPKAGTEIEVETRGFWNQKNTLLKLQIPMTDDGCSYFGQTAFGIQEMPSNGNEAVSQKWVTVINSKKNKCLTCINDGIYSSDFTGGNLRLTLLRSPAYSGHPVDKKEILMTDRFTNRIDQGERVFRLWINGGTINERFNNIQNEALYKNEKPFSLSFFPSGFGTKPKPFALLDNKIIEISAIKKAESSNDWIIRLYNSNDRKQLASLHLPVLKIKKAFNFGPFEIKTLRVNSKGNIFEVSLIEDKI
ncbi:MAG: alpha-mannosidase [Planctomycetes bacterium GWF2_41_51]|nr:MAG: alpha-mannosidase [Planctomycetes bacterium GWF2_41_51]HBG26044.1 alpha-mannosidase [Phycisphaerales bacterium]